MLFSLPSKYSILPWFGNFIPKIVIYALKYKPTTSNDVAILIISYLVDIIDVLKDTKIAHIKFRNSDTIFSQLLMSLNFLISMSVSDNVDAIYT